jgi:hypothetical protein
MASKKMKGVDPRKTDNFKAGGEYQQHTVQQSGRKAPAKKGGAPGGSMMQSLFGGKKPGG